MCRSHYIAAQPATNSDFLSIIMGTTSRLGLLFVGHLSDRRQQTHQTNPRTSDNTSSVIQMFYLLLIWKILVNQCKCQIVPAIPVAVNIIEWTPWWVRMRVVIKFCYRHLYHRQIRSSCFKSVEVRKRIVTCI